MWPKACLGSPGTIPLPWSVPTAAGVPRTQAHSRPGDRRSFVFRHRLNLVKGQCFVRSRQIEYRQPIYELDAHWSACPTNDQFRYSLAQRQFAAASVLGDDLGCLIIKGKGRPHAISVSLFTIDAPIDT